MQNLFFDTLSEAIDHFTKAGYQEDFEAEADAILANFSRKKYQTSELEIVDFYRFEGNTNPEDQALVLAIEAHDGTKGTLVMSMSYEHGQNTDLIKAIPYKNKPQ